MPDSSKARILEAVIEQGRIRFVEPVNWENGTRIFFRVEHVVPASSATPLTGEFDLRNERVIVAGYGPPGRWVGEILKRHGLKFVIIDTNAKTVEQQKKLGQPAIVGDAADEAVLREAGIEQASTLLLTMPDEKAVIKATEIARRLKPDLYIVARTAHTSGGMKARQAGADEAIKAEQTVARRFYDLLAARLAQSTSTES